MNDVYVLLLFTALAGIDCLIGGTRLLFSLPAYGVLALGGILSLFPAFRNKAAPNPACLLSILLLSTYLLIRNWYSPIPYLARPDFFMILGSLSMYLLVAFYVTTPHDRLLLVSGLLLLAALEVFAGLTQFARGNEFMLFGFIRAPMGTRASGMFISPNHFAGFLEVAGILGVSVTVWGRWPLWAKIVTGYLSLGCYVGVAISGSRGGYLSVTFSILVFTLLSLGVVGHNDRRNFGKAAAAAVLVIALFLGGAVFFMTRSPSLSQRLSRLFAKEVRFYNWQAALAQFRVAPVFGTGAGTHLIYGRLFRNPHLQTDPVHAHGDYLELLAEYGAAGAACMVLFLWNHIACGLNAAQRLAKRFAGRGALSNQLALTLGALSSVGAYLMHSVFDFNLHIPGNALLLAFVFGILANPVVETGDVRSARSWTEFARFALPILGITIAVLGLPKLRGEYYAEQSRVALRNGKFQDSIALATKGLVFEKQNPDLYFYVGEANRALANAMTGDWPRFLFFDSAVNAYKAARKLLPEDEKILVGLAQSLDGLQEYDAADEAYRTAVSWDPDLAVIHTFYGDGLKTAGRAAEAAEQYRQAAEMGSQPHFEEPKAPGRL